MLSASANPSRSFKVFAIAAFIAAASILIAAGVRTDHASAASKTTVVLGNDTNMPSPLCPGACQVIPSITGIQNTLPSGLSPYRVPFDGYITKWTIYLSKPTKAQRDSLNESFGNPPQAGISVLRKKTISGGRTQYLLKKSSPIEGLNRYLGTAASFKLDKPMKVNAGSIIGLTVPTWAPALAAGSPLSEAGNTWRASRDPGKCGVGQIGMAKPQTKVGTLRYYACQFNQSRLLYTVKITNTVGPTVAYCGTRPGDGAYNYVKAQGVDCSTGKTVAAAATDRFCSKRADCSYAGSRKNKVYAGKVNYGNWSCTASQARLEGNIRCTKSDGRLVYQAYGSDS